MSRVLFSWGQTKPHTALVELMLTKAAAFHICRKPELVYGYRWPNADGTAADYDDKCWHIRDEGCTAGADSRGLECCQALLEGLQEGWALRGTTKVRA